MYTNLKPHATAAEAYNQTKIQNRHAVVITTYTGDVSTKEYYSFTSKVDTYYSTEELENDFPLQLRSNQSINEIDPN